jgi:RNA polymerase sigma-70 factor (ECF subfamily)
VTDDTQRDNVRRAIEGDLDAFDAVVHHHAPAAYRLAVAVVGETLARDLVGDGFLAAWRQLGHLRDEARIEPWLQRIVLSRGRAILRSGRAVHEIPANAWREGTLVAPHDGMGAAEARAVLESAFGRLAYDQRALVALHYAAGLSLGDVAAALDLTVGAARTRLAASLEALRKLSGVDRADGAVSPYARPGAGAARGSRPGGVVDTATSPGDVAPSTEGRMPPQQPHLEAFLESLADVAVPADLAGAVMSHVREHPARRASLRLPILALVAGLLLAVAAAMAAGWSPPFDILPGPPAPTLAPVASPSPSTSPLP